MGRSPLLLDGSKAQILSSRKTRIKTSNQQVEGPEVQGTQILSSRKTRIKTCTRRPSVLPWELRYYPPEKQGLRLPLCPMMQPRSMPQILSSRKTRIKTDEWIAEHDVDRETQILSSRKTRIKTVSVSVHTDTMSSSDTILQKNKD